MKSNWKRLALRTNLRMVVALYLVLLQSCNSAITSESVSIDAITRLPGETKIANETPTATPTVFQDIKVTREPTSEPSPSWQIKEQCIPINNQPSEEDLFSGMLILNGLSKTYTYDLAKRITVPFPSSPDAIVGQYNYDFNISPDNNWLAYIENYVDAAGQTQYRRLRLMDNNLNRHLVSEWDVDWQWMIDWVNNQYLALLLPNRKDGVITILNPFTGQFQELSLPYKFPEKGSFSSSWYFSGRPLLYYDPNLINVVFPNKDGKVILWDTQDQKELWTGTITDYVASSNTVWSKDGSSLIVVTSGNNREEMTWINLEGEKTSNIPLDLATNIERFSLSPDGQIIATWVSDDPYGFKNQMLFLIDLSRREILNTCLESSVFTHEPVWSFNSNGLAITINEANTNKVILIDRENYAATILIADDVQPVGWLQSK